MREGRLNGSRCLGCFKLSKRCRCLCGLSTSDQANHRFVVGSFEDTTDNEVLILDFNEDTNELSQVGSVNGLLPIRCLVPSSKQEDRINLLISTYNINTKDYNVEFIDDEYKRQPLEGSFRNLRSIIIDPHCDEKYTILTRNKISLHQLQVDSSFKELLSVDGDENDVFNVGKYDPHHPDLFITSSIDRFKVIDFRQKLSGVDSISSRIHIGTILDLDFNPNVPNELVTVGEDNRIIFWDIRHIKSPIIVHDTTFTRWITNVNYNTYHDQLILLSHIDGISLFKKDINCQQLFNIDDITSHIAWSETDAWHFSYINPTHLVINSIPSNIKYNLLASTDVTEDNVVD